jgi:HlyD family secretion protein
MIRRIREMVLSLTSMCIAVIALSSLLIASYELETWPWVEHKPLRERYEFRTVRRTTLSPILSAPGRVESSRRTVIRCQLENLAGTSSSSGGASTVLWLIPEGTTVKAGEVLARLDSSAYEEMHRQQSIVVEQSKASHLQARLVYEISQLAVREYNEGTVQQTVQQMEGNLAMSRSDLNRTQQRLEWTKMMNKKGYTSVAQIETDRQAVTSADLALQRQLGTYDLFMRFTKPKTQKTLQGDVTSAQTSMNNEYVKLQRQLERFETLTKQVDRCTIRAPHDGIVYYYKNSGRGGGGPNSQNGPIEEGAPVRQNKELFYLPDLSDMEIQMALNESVVSRIAPGMRAKARFEALPQVVLEGEVTSVDQIPVQQNDRGEDVRYFWGIVKLDRSGEGLKPGMTAQVEIALANRTDVLAIPHEAVVSEQNRQVCFLPREEHLERREVKVGLGTTDWIEITGGLSEGDEVALNPPVWGGHPQSLSGFDDSDPWPAIDFSKKAAAAPKSGERDEASASKGAERRKGRRNPGDPTRKTRKRANTESDAAPE